MHFSTEDVPGFGQKILDGCDIACLRQERTLLLGSLASPLIGQPPRPRVRSDIEQLQH